MIPRRPSRILIHSFGYLLMAHAANSGTTWDGGGSDDNWGTGANWNPDGAPSPGNTVDLTFAGTTRLTPVNNYTAFDDFRSIFFDATAGAFSLSGNAIDLFGKIENYSTATQTLAMDLAINTGQPGTGEFNPINGDLVINSANVFGNGNTLHVYGVNGKTVTFGAGTVISGSGTHFNVEQASNAVFLGANTYTGTTNVLAGSLTIGGGGTTGAHGTGTVTVASGATLTYNRSDDITIANVLAGAGSYVKAGAGVLSLTGANTLSGTLTISNGTVNVGANANALGTASVVLGDAATGAGNVALLTTTADVARPITVSALGTGTATIGSTTGASGNLVFSGLLTLNRPTTLTAASTDRTTYTGKITGSVGTLTIAGGQRTVLDNTTNDFVGNIVVTGTNTTLQTGVATGSEHIPDGSSIDIGPGALVKLAGAVGSVETINALSGSGTIRRHEGVGGVQTLVLGSAGGSGSFSGLLLNGPDPNSLAIRKEGGGTQTITSVGNSASGGITVNGGTLKFTGTAGFDDGTFNTAQTYTVNPTATLEIDGDWLTKSTSTYTINGGTLRFSKNTGALALNYINALNLTNGTVTSATSAGFRSGNLPAGVTHTFSGNDGNTIASVVELIKVHPTQIITLNVADGTADADLTISGLIRDGAGDSTLAKTGAGKLILSGANTYAGPTVISAGRVETSSNTGFGTSSITIGDGAATTALYLNNRADIGNAVTVSAAGSGTVTLGATNTGSGADAASFTGTVTLNRATTFSSEIAGDRLTFDGKVTGNVGLLTVTGGQRTTLTNPANDFVGDILVTGTGTVLQPTAGTAGEAIPDGSSVTVDAGAVFQLAASSGVSERINALKGSGTVQNYPLIGLGTGLTVGSAGGSGTFSGAVIQNGGSPLALTKIGTGTQTLTGSNTYSGTTTVSGGTLELSGTGALTQTSEINITGGTLLVGSTAGDRLNNAAGVKLNRDSLSSAALGFSGTVTETTGALSLLSDSVIDMGGGDADITFASLSVTAGKKLAVWNWTGTLWNINGTDRLLFTSGTAGTDFADVQFYSDSGTTAIGSGAKFLTNGGIVELVPVPEPGAVAAAGLLLGAITWRGRRAAVRRGLV
ncbi:MAG: autotransporter-associated beta strand repeat-containing protein [Verrucomicrobiales bacterium]|nr:autotransporter-associated beta strand repeat-containing protein [Verrucomicrobiales bacterium]